MTVTRNSNGFKLESEWVYHNVPPKIPKLPSPSVFLILTSLVSIPPYHMVLRHMHIFAATCTISFKIPHHSHFKTPVPHPDSPPTFPAAAGVVAVFSWC